MASISWRLPAASVCRLALTTALVTSVLAMAGSVSALEAQGLAAFAPLNPMVTSRSGVYFQPYHDPAPGRWTVGLDLDYGSAVEYNDLGGAQYILDAELMRLNLGLQRDLGARNFILVDVGARGAYDGFMDGFLDWYHERLGIRLQERERRPRNEFLYLVSPRQGPSVERDAGSFFLSDARVGFGRRYSRHLQGVLSVTLPTATGADGYGRGVVSANVLHTLRAPLSRRLTYEGAVGLGYAPRHGPLRDFERDVFGSVSSGLRLRIWSQQALFANLIYDAPYYHDTGLRALDRYDLALDFGWMRTTCRGNQWRIGMTEDPKPSGPGIDLIFRLGVALRTGTGPCAAARTPSRPVRGD